MRGKAIEQQIAVSSDEQGRILIPVAMSEPLGLTPGMMLVVEQADEGMIGLRIQSEPPLVNKGGVLVVSAEALDDFADAANDERDRRAMDLLGRTGL